MFDFERENKGLVYVVIIEGSLENLGNGEKKRKHTSDPVIFNLQNIEVVLDDQHHLTQ